jgi:hypothetical protein
MRTKKNSNMEGSNFQSIKEDKMTQIMWLFQPWIRYRKNIICEKAKKRIWQTQR